MIMFYAFDIETMRNGSLVGSLPEPEVKAGNLRDPEKIAAKQAEAKAAQIEKMALNPLYGRICAAVFYNPEQPKIELVAGDSDEEEKLLLAECFKILQRDNLHIVTWNGMNFDLPFLFRRALILDVPIGDTPVLSFWTRKFETHSAHLDLMQVWAGWNSQNYTKLDEVGAVVAHDRKIEIDFHDFPELVKTNEGRTKLLAYCAQDTVLTWKIMEKFNRVMF